MKTRCYVCQKPLIPGATLRVYELDAGPHGRVWDVCGPRSGPCAMTMAPPTKYMEALLESGMTDITDAREFVVIGEREAVLRLSSAILRKLFAAADAATLARLHRGTAKELPFEMTCGEDIVGLWLDDRRIATTGWKIERKR